MPSILVIEHEGRYIERIQDALSSEGWKTRFVAGRPEALRAAASEQPDLVLINSDLPGAAEMLRTFATHQGGPGAVALIPEHQAPVAPAEMGADEVVAKPFTDQQLRLVVRRGLNRPQGDTAAGTEAAAGATPDPDEGPKLTSEDIFGDLLQEVDSAPAGEGAAAGKPAAREPAAQPPSAAEPASPPAPAPPPAARPPAGRPRGKAPRADSRLGSDDPEIAKRLEMTLSGVLEESPAGSGKGKPRRGGEDAAKSPAAPKGQPPTTGERPEGDAGPSRTSRKRKPKRGSDDVDELLNLTLSSLEEPKKRKAKKRRKRSAEVDLSEIAALAGGRKKPAARRPEPPAAPAVAGGDSLEPPPLPGAADLEVPEEFDLHAVDGGDAEAAAPDLRAPDLDLPDLEAREVEAGGVDAAGAGPSAAPAADRDSFDDETFNEVFDASWGEAVPEEEDGSYEVKPPDDFEPRGLGDDGGTGTGTATGTATETATETSRESTERADDVTQADGERFGHYHLLDRIAVGGMAEVWKARMSGVEGFQKTVAIKKILPQMTDNKDFVSMFIDEAKLAAQLNHPNITHIYDLGKIERDYYIAMEYVEGRNLRDVLNQARRKGKPLPVGLALVIAARLASGLDYAHRKRDFDDRELELVHRDVSPQNVLLSYEGDIKLCDFGIVKAVTKATHTQMGALKGKLQYMSPEQAWGRTVDSRSDIFSLGALLFEMLTGERLFAGDNEISVLESVRECHVRSPEELNPGLPAGVEEIAQRALAKKPDDRYGNAGEMQGELEAILYRLKPTPTQADLGTWLRELDRAEDLDDEARQRFTWDTGAAVVAAGSGGDGGAAAADVRPGGDGVASPFGVAPGDVAATQPIRLPDADAAPGATRAESGTGTGTAATGSSEPDSAGRLTGTGTGEGTGTGIGTGTDSDTRTDSGSGTGVGLPPEGDTDGGEAADATFGEGTATAMAPPEGEKVTPEEGGRKGLRILVAVIVLLLILGAVWFFSFPAGDSAPTTEPSPAATEPVTTPAAGEPGAAPSSEDTAAPADSEAATEGNAAGEMNLEAMLDEQMEAKEAEIESAVREDREPELERLRAELRRLREREAQALADAAAAEAAAREREEAAAEGGDGGAESSGGGAGDG